MSYSLKAHRSFRFLVILVFFFVSLEGLQAQSPNVTPNDYRLNPTDGCFIKALKNRSYVDVPLSSFANSKIHAVPHPRRPKYFAFKNAGVIHVIPKKCLVVWDTPDDEFDGLNDMEETDNFEKYERLNKAASENRLLNSIELSDMKYFIELRGGLALMNDGNASFAKDSRTYMNGMTTLNVASTDQIEAPVNSPAIGLEVGYRKGKSFFTLGFKRFSSSRRDQVTFDNSDKLGIDIKETINTIYIGSRYYFTEKGAILPNFALRLGLSSGSLTETTKPIQGSFTIPNPSRTFDGSSLVLNPEFGLDFLISRNIILGFKAGYDLHINRKYVIKGQDESATTKLGYQSTFNYSHLYALVGLAYYFK